MRRPHPDLSAIVTHPAYLPPRRHLLRLPCRFPASPARQARPQPTRPPHARIRRHGVSLQRCTHNSLGFYHLPAASHPSSHWRIRCESPSGKPWAKHHGPGACKSEYADIAQSPLRPFCAKTTPRHNRVRLLRPAESPGYRLRRLPS